MKKNIFEINGFGRIGRNILRAHIERQDSSVHLAVINDLAPLDHAAFLLEYDSVHGWLDADIRHDDSHLQKILTVFIEELNYLTIQDITASRAKLNALLLPIGEV